MPLGQARLDDVFGKEMSHVKMSDLSLTSSVNHAETVCFFRYRKLPSQLETDMENTECLHRR